MLPLHRKRKDGVWFISNISYAATWKKMNSRSYSEWHVLFFEQLTSLHFSIIQWGKWWFLMIDTTPSLLSPQSGGFRRHVWSKWAQPSLQFSQPPVGAAGELRDVSCCPQRPSIPSDFTSHISLFIKQGPSGEEVTLQTRCVHAPHSSGDGQKCRLWINQQESTLSWTQSESRSRHNSTDPMRM